MDTDSTPMTTPNSPQTSGLTASSATGAIVSSGWLAGETTFGGSTDKRKIGGAMAASVLSHVGLLFVILAVLSIKPAVSLLTENQDKPKFVFLQESGPGGGGGGSPAPAPRKQLEVPKHKAPEPVPVDTDPCATSSRRRCPLCSRRLRRTRRTSSRPRA